MSTDEKALKAAIEILGKHDTHYSEWSLDEGHLRSFIADYEAAKASGQPREWETPQSTHEGPCVGYRLNAEGKFICEQCSAAKLQPVLFPVKFSDIPEWLVEVVVEQTLRHIGPDMGRESIVRLAIDQFESSLRNAGHLKRESGWQPIDTAPKDGTRILISDGKSGGSASWSKHMEMWSDTGGDYSSDPTTPTHWMPLPKPPINRSEDREGS